MNTYESTYRKTLKDIENGKRTSPLTAIKLWCQQCVGFSAKDVEDCCGDKGDPACILFKFRKGKNKSGKRTGKFSGKVKFGKP